MDFLHLSDKIFIVIKPGFNEISNKIIEEFKQHGFALSNMKPKRLTLNEAKSLYRVHHKEDFYNDLCKYMSSGVSIGVLFQHNLDTETAFEKLDKIKSKIRDKYSKNDMENVMHSSDKFENMQKECRKYF